MCKTCLREGWRAIWDKGRKLLEAMEGKPCWHTTTYADGTQQVHGPQLKTRLKNLWDFLRLQHRLHLSEESSTAAHCLRMSLGSLADSRLDEPCRHPHSEPTRCPPIPALDPKCTEKCAESGCKTRAAANCKYCPVSWCRPHLENKLCRSEHLPAATSEFVCPQCRPKIDAHRHSKEGCATCNEIEFFKEDLVLCARRTKCADLISKALNLCDAIDTIVGHNARIVNQERFWPAALDRMKDRKQYDHVLLKSDYWKKFEGTALKVGLTLNPTLTLTLTLNLNPYPNPNTEFATRWVYVKQTRSRV